MMRRMLRLRLGLGRQALPALAPVGLVEALVALLVAALADFSLGWQARSGVASPRFARSWRLPARVDRRQPNRLTS